jgi:hypothetical protein
MTFLDVLKQDARWILDQGPVVSDEFELRCSQAIHDLILAEFETGDIIFPAHLKDNPGPKRMTRLQLPGAGSLNITIKEQPGYDLSLKLPNL